MSFWEIVVILIVALLVVGPKKLPEFARKAGELIGAIQKIFSKVSSDVQNEFHLQNNEQRAKQADKQYIEKRKE